MSMRNAVIYFYFWKFKATRAAFYIYLFTFGNTTKQILFVILWLPDWIRQPMRDLHFDRTSINLNMWKRHGSQDSMGRNYTWMYSAVKLGTYQKLRENETGQWNTIGYFYINFIWGYRYWASYSFISYHFKHFQ